jgi:endonuclease YncB( thermonuclease family)
VAVRALAAMIERWPVTCEAKGQDNHGRTVALCRAGGRDLGAAMVVSGMALAVPADGDDYVAQEAEARRARVGMHAHACLAPSEWRAQRGLGH